MIRTRPIAAALFFFLASSAAAEEQNYSLDAVQCQGLFIVPVTLERNDGRSAAERTLWFAYDTGASSTYVDPDSILRVSGVAVEENQRVVLNDASAGDIKFKALPASVAELDHLSMALGRRLDGIFAVDAFKNFLITLNYEQETLSLRRGSLGDIDGRRIISIRGRDKRPWAVISVDGEKRRILIDSGATSGFSLFDLGHFELNSPRVPLRSSMRFNRVEHGYAARLAHDINFASVKFITPVVAEATRTELFGAKQLKHFTWTFDLRNKRAQVDPVTSDPIVSAPEYTAGVTLGFDGTNMIVAEVAEGGPAAAAGLRKDDIIRRASGEALEERGCRPLFGRTPVTLSVERKNEILNIKVTPTVAVP